MNDHDDKNRMNEWAGIIAIASLVLSPLITYAVSQAVHGQRIATVEQEVVTLRAKQDENYKLLTEIVQRLARIESKLEK